MELPAIPGAPQERRPGVPPGAPARRHAEGPRGPIGQGLPRGRVHPAADRRPRRVRKLGLRRAREDPRRVRPGPVLERLFRPGPLHLREKGGAGGAMLRSSVMSPSMGMGGAGLGAAGLPSTELMNDYMQQTMAASRNQIGQIEAGSAPKEVVKIKCRNCGSLEAEDAAYCRKCGQPL